jgi:hypothetical protein
MVRPTRLPVLQFGDEMRFLTDRTLSSYDSSLGKFVVLLAVYCILQMASHKSGCVRCSGESANINTSANPAKILKVS